MQFMNEENYKYYMETNVKPYVNEWIAIVDKKIVSHGKDVKKVFNEARKQYPNKTPLISKVPGKQTMIL